MWAMPNTHNFWSFHHVIKRIKDVAEEYGIKVKEVSEHKTSTRCPSCDSENIVNTGRFFRCLDCGLEAHRDAVGFLSIGSRQGESINGVMTYPLLLKWNGMRWEAKRSMNNRPTKTLEARIPQGLSRGSVKVQ